MTPHPLDTIREAQLARVLAALGSQDAGERAKAAAAVHAFVQGLGVDWTDVAGSILVTSLRARDLAPRQHPDTHWRPLFDDDCRFGFWRWLSNKTLTVRHHSAYSDKGRVLYWASIDGSVLRDTGDRPQLFSDQADAQAAAEFAARTTATDTAATLIEQLLDIPGD